MAALADGRVVSTSHDLTVRVWDFAAGAAVAVFTLDAPVVAVAVGAGGVVTTCRLDREDQAVCPLRSPEPS